MRQQVAGLVLRARRWNGERVVGMALGVGHRETDDQAGPLVEGLGRDHQHRMVVGHLFADGRAVLYEDDLGAFRHPER